MKLLKGVEVAKAINEEVRTKMGKSGSVPHLDIVRLGARPDDLSYERGILKKMDNLGIRADVHDMPVDIDAPVFYEAIEQISASPSVDGILMFMPLPGHIDSKHVSEIIDPAKDMDGISPINQAKIYAGDKSGIAPCTAEAVVALLDHYGIDVSGKRVTVVGRSLVIGRPVAMMLMQKNATVTICHTRTTDLDFECRRADIVIAAAGVPRMITANYISDGAVVIDVGIHVDEDGNMCGDVDFDDVSPKCSAITPVPGGVGAVTTSILARHLCVQ